MACQLGAVSEVAKATCSAWLPFTWSAISSNSTACPTSMAANSTFSAIEAALKKMFCEPPSTRMRPHVEPNDFTTLVTKPWVTD